MGIFEGDDSCKEDDSLLCEGEFGLNCGVASDKGVWIPWVCVCIDSRYVVSDAASGECVESADIFGSLVLSLFILISTGLIKGLFNNLSTLSCKQSLLISLKIGAFTASTCIVLISERLPPFRILVTT